jgi:predicted glycosyltransferase
MENLRYIKTKENFKKDQIVQLTEPDKDNQIVRRYRVIMSSDLFTDESDLYYTILEEIKGKVQ